MPVKSISLTPDENYIDIYFDGGGSFYIDVSDATIDLNESNDIVEVYGFSNPHFAINITPSENAFTITIGHNENDIVYFDTISDALIEQLKDIIHTIKKTLRISNATHIGVLREGTDILITDRNSISLDDFKDGEECVLIKHPNGNFTTNGEKCFVYHVETLQDWFDAGKTTEPLTRVPITQEMLQRFTYSKQAGGARSSRKSKGRKTRKGKSRK